MKRRCLSAILALSALLELAFPASAGLSWCKTDPIVTISGTAVQILVSLPQEYTQYVDGAIKVNLTTTKGVDRRVIITDSGYNGNGETVNWSEDNSLSNFFGALPVGITVRIPMDQSEVNRAKVPMMVEVIPENGPQVVFVGTAEKATTLVHIIGQ